MTLAPGNYRMILVFTFVYILSMAFLLLDFDRIFLLKLMRLHNPSPYAKDRKTCARGGFKENARKVDLLIVVLSASSNFQRRLVIRQTWWKSCESNSKVSCWFFTDKLASVGKNQTRRKLLMEQRQYEDVIFSPVGRGIHFGLRFLHLMQWGKENYDFKYIMRIDDDIMLCLDHLLWDLPNFPLTSVHYGWLHCQGEKLVYIDEGMAMFSSDVIETFLSQKSNETLCHPFGDQQIAIWEQELGLIRTILRPDNDRIHHTPPASRSKALRNNNNLCNRYIAIHGLYANDMIEFWQRRGNKSYNSFVEKGSKAFCRYEPALRWQSFGGIYRQEPKPCALGPQWDLHNHTRYRGRERRSTRTSVS